MVPTLKAEFKKLLTVRSTYILALLAITLTSLFTYFGTSKVPVYEVEKVETNAQQSDGSNSPPQSGEGESTEVGPGELKFSSDLPKETLIANFQESIPPASIFIAVVVVLLMAHEFRYNTIMHTLTASNSRSRVLVSKMLVGVTFTIVVASLVIVAAVAFTYLAVSVKDLNLPPQDFSWLYVVSRSLGYALGFSLLGLAVITLVRNTVAGVVALFLLPTIDAIAASILASQKFELAEYTPFTALGRLGNVAGSEAIMSGNAPMTVTGAITLTLLYLVIIWAVSWYLFLRRDAA